MDKPIDWTNFKRKILIDTDLKKVYDAWTIPAQIRQWFLQEAKYVSEDGEQRGTAENYQKGDRYEWKWHNWDGIEKGKVLEANGIDRIEFEFAEGVVSIDLENKEGRTLLTLEQRGIGTDEVSRYNVFYGCSLGWSFWMVNIKAWLEHGITLNETQDVETDGIMWVNT